MASEEQIIVRAFLDDRETYEKYAPYILGLKNLERNMKLMLGYTKKFYEKYPDVDRCPESDFRLYLGAYDTMNFVNNNDAYIKEIYSLDMTNKNLTLDVIEGSVEKHIMSRVLDKCAVVLDNNKKGIISTIQDDVDEYHQIIRNPPKDMVEYQLNLQELIKGEITTKGIPFVNDTPNNVLRGMRKGQLGLIYAYVDTGKTSYGVANLCSVAQYLHHNKDPRPVVYACNEEDVSRVSLRAIQCMTNWNNAEIALNEPTVNSIIKAKGFDCIRFVDHITNMRLIEKVLAKYGPAVMFIDQGTKVKPPGNKEGVDALEETFNQYRDLAKRYSCTIISMAQGGEGCFNKKRPELKDIYGSKSAIQGELDWAISIGTDNSDVKYQNFRYFSITKNKGGKATYECRFDFERCQFKEVV
jgi:hypothetical protein